MDDRFERLAEIVFEKLHSVNSRQLDLAILHLYGVAILCSLIAMKRTLNNEICKSAGILHDLWLFLNVPLTPNEHQKHGVYGSIRAREILNSMGTYTNDEIDRICTMIYFHNDKNVVNGEYDEVLKDADALQHYLNNSEYDKKYPYNGRQLKVLNELEITDSL
jgi:uncharacterized protein